MCYKNNMSKRDAGEIRLLSDTQRDLRYAMRTIRRSPGFALVVVLTLGLGIGATTAIFSVIDTILLRPLPFRDADRLVSVVQNMPPPRAGAPPYTRGFTRPELLEWRERSTTLSDLVGIGTSIGIVKTSDGTARLWGGMTDARTLSMLGMPAMLGRTIVDTDESNPNVVVLSFDTWRRVFHADPEIIGKSLAFLTVEQAARPRVVIGVMPPEFEFPTARMEFLVPFDLGDAAWQKTTRLTLIGRVRAGATLEAARQEALAIGTAITAPLPANAPPLALPRFEVRNLKDATTRELQPALRVLLAAVAVVLMIVCANVANLLLARGTSRQGEIAVRFALGASRWRIVREVAAECALLAVAGGVVGAAIGAAGVALVQKLAVIDAPGVFRFSLGASILPRAQEIAVSSRMFAIAFGITALAGVAFGLLPALHVSRSSPVGALGRRGAVTSREGSRMRVVLAVGQLVMATTLSIGAGLLIHSFVRLLAVDRGYDPSNALAFQLVFPPGHSIARKTDAIEGILSKLRSAPEVAAAGFSRHGMLIGEQITVGTFVPQGRTLDEMKSNPLPSLRPVSGGYLTAVGARMVEGRDIRPNRDEFPPPIVISQRTARIFGSGPQIGRLVEWYWGEQRVPLQVVGVVADLRNTKAELEPFPEVFINYRDVLKVQQRLGETPLWQHERSLGLLSFAVRTRTGAASPAEMARRIVRDVDPAAGIDAMRPLDQLVASSVARPRFYAVVLALFAGAAGLLAAAGIFGVLAYMVEQRRREIGLRIALGAQRHQVLMLIVRNGLKVTLVGLALGLGGSAAAARVIQGMLFGVTPLDPATFAGVGVLIGLVALIASYLPARRATRVDPMLALRSE
jgi:putative ABC transport system permease protein